MIISTKYNSKMLQSGSVIYVWCFTVLPSFGTPSGSAYYSFEQKKALPMARLLAVLSLDLDYSVIIIFLQGYCVNRGCLALEHQPILLVTLWTCVVPMDHF